YQYAAAGDGTAGPWRVSTASTPRAMAIALHGDSLYAVEQRSDGSLLVQSAQIGSGGSLGAFQDSAEGPPPPVSYSRVLPQAVGNDRLFIPLMDDQHNLTILRIAFEGRGSVNPTAIYFGGPSLAGNAPAIAVTANDIHVIDGPRVWSASLASIESLAGYT